MQIQDHTSDHESAGERNLDIFVLKMEFESYSLEQMTLVDVQIPCFLGFPTISQLNVFECPWYHTQRERLHFWKFLAR